MIAFNVVLFLMASIFTQAFSEPLPPRPLGIYGYDRKFKDISLNTNQSVAILVIAFNRPEYFAQLLASLESNPESQHIPFYFALDGGPRATQKENIELIHKSSIKNKEILLRKRNYGICKNYIDAKRFLFDWCQYDKVIVIEEDLIVSPNYIKVTLDLHNWAKENYSNIGAVSCWSYCFLDRETKQRCLNMVKRPRYFWSFVTYCLDKDVWNDIKPLVYEYELFIDKIPYTDDFARQRSKPGLWSGKQQIFSWIKDVAKQKCERNSQSEGAVGTENKKKFASGATDWKIAKMYCAESINWQQLNQDNIFAFCFWLKGYIKVETVVNRVKHIGDYGVSHNPGKDSRGLGRVNLDNFAEDSAEHNFLAV